jgi:hypothetical protein
MKIYIIGKVTGLEYESCCELFAERQRELEAMGHEVVNPISVVPDGTPWIPAMKLCIKQLVDCDGYSRLPNALNSKGGLLELFVACELKLAEV